jgi:hypothetical protein
MENPSIDDSDYTTNLNNNDSIKMQLLDKLELFLVFSAALAVGG